MNENKNLSIRKLPTIDQLYGDTDLAVAQNELKLLLNSPPRSEWVKENAFANGYKYLPIEKVEYLLSVIFPKWWVEVKDIKLIANAVVVSIRLYVVNPTSGEIEYNDGVGAQEIQTAKGANATDFTQINKGAIQMAAPAAKSYAIKDAAECFGKIFGKDLNRRDAADINERLFGQNEAMQSEKDLIKESISSCTTLEELEGYGKTFAKSLARSKELTKLFTDKKVELQNKKP